MLAIERKYHLTPNIQSTKDSRLYKASLTSKSLIAPSIDSNFNEFISKFVTTEIQNRVAYDITDELIKISPNQQITFERALEDNEIVIINQNERAQNIIVLDSEGDIMISHSPFKGGGWREFINYKELDLESVVYKFLSL